MKKLDGPALGVVLYEGIGSLPIADGERLTILRALLERGYAVSCTRSGGSLARADSGALLVLGRQRRTITGPLRRALIAERLGQKLLPRGR